MQAIEEEKKGCGENSPYWVWVSLNGGVDPCNVDELTDEAFPWAPLRHSEEIEEKWQVLKEIFPTLPPRQQEVVCLLLAGHTSQTAIAAMLGITQPIVHRILQSLKKKIVSGLDRA